MKKFFQFLGKLKKILPLKIIYSLFFLYLALIISALLEMIGIGSIPVFISILIDPTNNREFFGINMDVFFQFFGSEKDVKKLFAIFIISLFSFKILFVFLTTLFQLRITKSIKLHFSEKLLNSYLFRPYIFFVNKNSAELSRNMLSETGNAVGFLSSIINISREFAILAIIFALLVFFDPLVSISAFGLLVAFSLIFYLSTNKLIKKSADDRFYSLGSLFKIVNLSFGAIKDLKIYNKEKFFLKKFNEYNETHEKNILFRELVVKLPRLIFELVGVVLVIGVTLFFVYFNKDTVKLLPALALIAISTIRLMPSFSSISSSLTYIRSWKKSFDLVEKEILDFNSNFAMFNNNNFGNLKTKNKNNNAIEMKNLSFYYPGTANGASLTDVSLNIKKGEMIGIIGKSGAGKSTIANIILNLLDPNKGEINVFSSHSAKQAIAYIPQDIFLIDDTLRRNIAFGENDNDIHDSKIIESLKGAELTDFAKNHSEGLNLIIGERGIKLSGGERQRLGIARALYRDPEILIMDEATSSLDNFTEKQVMNSIKKLKNKHTIVMIAHRLTTIESCDRIYLIESGKIKDSGTLPVLLKKYPYLDNYNKEKK